MADTNSTKKTVTEYNLQFAGLFGRNRKPKRGSVVVAEVEPGTVVTDLRAKVDAALAAAKVKPGAKWQVIATDVTIEKGEVFNSRSFMMFSGKKVLEGTVA